MNHIRFTLLFLLSVVSTSAATLSGTVRDAQGTAISNGHVIVHWDPAGANYLKDNLGSKQDLAATTDSNGHFSAELPPGFYDVFVTAMAFTPHCDKVRIKNNQANTYEVKLKISPVTSKELD